MERNESAGVQKSRLDNENTDGKSDRTRGSERVLVGADDYDSLSREILDVFQTVGASEHTFVGLIFFLLAVA